LTTSQLHHWNIRVIELYTHFYVLRFEHVYRQLNQVVDSLSKMVLGSAIGILHYLEINDNEEVDRGSKKGFLSSILIHVDS